MEEKQDSKTMEKENSITLVESQDPERTPRRIAYFPKKTPVRFEAEKEEEKLVMTFPHLIIREVICFQILFIILTIFALFFNAPLGELANPQHTPNPAKAPWYFVGLQELIHSFPPLIAGVILPIMVIIALIVIPYFEINLKRRGLWEENPRRMFVIISSLVGVILILTLPFHVFSVAIPTFLIYLLALLPYFVRRESGWIHWLSKRSISEWIMTWFVIVAAILTIIGAIFRGPGWSWVWPWQ